MKCFAFAMEKEARPLLEQAEVISSKKCGYATIYEVKKDGLSFLVGVSGIGKAFAASLIASVCLLHPEVDEIINVGVGGSIDAEKAPLLSAVIASSFTEHDLDTSPIGDPVGMVSGINLIYLPASKSINGSLELACKSLNVPVCYGVMSSGDRFIVDSLEKKKIQDAFGTLSIDMESAPMAQIAYSHGKEFSALRIISDTGNAGEYEAYVHQAAKIATNVILALLEKDA